MYLKIIGFGYGTSSKSWMEMLNLVSSNISRIYYPLKGEGQLVINGEKKLLLRNHLYLIPQCCDIQFLHNPDAPFEHTYIDFTIMTEWNKNQMVDIDLKDNLILLHHIEFLKVYFFEYKLHKINRFGHIQAFEQHSEIIYHHTYALLKHLNNLYNIFSDSGSAIETTVTYIYNNYSKNISVSELAKIAHMEESYFIKCFKKTTGKTPYQYLKDYRFEIAFLMLEAGYPINAIAAAIGFSSSTAFSNSFKKTMGHYPSELKLSIKEKRTTTRREI